ncbi:MAG: ATPase, T2SS/T4P/T4SS family, partial [Candidatus Anammoxibacter sp.]
KAVSERASDIHIEPKEHSVVVRFRIDGVMRNILSLEPKIAVMVISRLKAYAEMDIAERRKPQDGSVPIVVNNRKFNFRLATALTPHGESIIIRLLETKAFTKDLNELGMTEEQKNIMVNLGKRTQGLILFVGQTGSGKTTTIYSLLHQMDCKSRSLISVEDPVEYSIPFANQEQVNEKAGITFEALLKSSVRQDPDILFIGEIRDALSANTCIDFASTGHLTISSMHTTNATTAIFRLERMDVDRQTMASSTVCIVAQKLLRKLCSSCKEVKPISEEETEMLLPFTDDIPTNVAHPTGCLKCGNTGYFGCEGIYEILQIDETISGMICSGRSILEIRKFIQERGDYLISDHAIEKVRKLIFPLKDVFETVLADEIKYKNLKTKPDVVKTKPIRSKVTDSETGSKTILIIEDDDDSRKLIEVFLETGGYKTLIAKDGIDALICLDKHVIDLVLSDVNMPDLDGFRLLEIMNQKGIETPVIFITARTSVEDEKTGLKLGAVDYIKKPIQKEILLLRIGNVLTTA